MVSVDEHTQVGIEIVSEGSKLTGELILKILQSVNDLLKRENEKDDFILNNNTKEGKQGIKDLVKKHSDGVMSFDDNLTKEQVGDYQKTFKKMGVDFSIVKNDHDSYSFFFASKDLNVIEKSLKNIIEKKNKEIENQKEITVQPEIENQEIQLVNSLKELSPQELALFMKINDIEIANKNNIDALNELKKGLSNEQISNIESLYKENIFTGNDIVSKNKILSTEINEIESNLENKDIQLENKKDEIEIKEKELQGKIKSLSPKEQELFNKMNELKELEGEVPNQQLMNIQALHSEYSSLTSKSKEEQLDSIFQQLSPDEKEYFLKTNEAMMDSNSAEKVDKLLEVKEKLSSEQINKVDSLYDKNVHIENDNTPKGKIHMNDVEKVAANLIENREKAIPNQVQETNISERFEPKLEFSTKEEQLNHIFNQLTDKEESLFMQMNNAEIEKLDNFYADSSSHHESNILDKMKGNFSKNDFDKVSKLYGSNISTAQYAGNAPKGKIHMDELGTVANKLTKEKQIEKVQSPKIFSVKGVQEIAKQIKEQEQGNDKDKNRSQTLSR